MRFRRHLVLLLAFISLFAITLPAISANLKTDARVAKSYGKLPLSFVENRGQMDKRARFVIRGPRASAFFRNDGVTFDLWEASKIKPLDKRDILKKGRLEAPSKPEVRKHAVLKLTFKGADPKCRVEGMNTLPGKVNYMIGKDKSKWHTNVPTYKGVIYKNVWQGIDIIYRGDRSQLKYDIQVNPGADIRNVQLRYDGAEKMWLDKNGDLHIKTAVTEFIEKVPGIYQEKDGKKIDVAGGYELLDKKTVSFSVNNIDSSLPLVIDPASDLMYSTFLGGSDDYGDGLQNITVDSSGCAYVIGETWSHDFPITPGAFDKVGGSNDAFVTKLDSTGSALVYSAFLGGLGSDIGGDISVDASACAYVTGTTSSPDFPTTPNAFNRTTSSYAIFVAKLNAAGNSLIYSTIIGRNDGFSPVPLAIDSSGCAYITGSTSSSSFPTTFGAYDRTYDGWSDAFISKLNASGTALVYSTFLGGDDDDSINSIVVDTSNHAYVIGGTNSTDFPTTPNSLNTIRSSDGYDAFVTKINEAGNGLVYSTFMKKNHNPADHGESIVSIAVDNSGCVYVTGYTKTSEFTTTPGAFDTTFGNGSTERFLAKINASGDELLYSTFLGGPGVLRSIAVDSSGCVYGGGSGVMGLPITPGAYSNTVVGASDAIVMKFNPSGSELLYSTFIGGDGEGSNGIVVESIRSIAVDSQGYIYAGGMTEGTSFPTTPGAFDTSYNQESSTSGCPFIIKLNVTPRRPDMLIKTSDEVSYSGTDVFNTDGTNQTKSQNASFNSAPAVYSFSVRNAGNVDDSFKITGPASGNGWTVSYYELATDADVTFLVTGSGWITDTLAPGASDGVYAIVGTDMTVPLGSTNTLLITAASEDDNTRIDVVKAVTSCIVGYQPDMLIKSGAESSYSGTDLYSADGSNQTKSQSAAPGQKITYTFKAKNAGNGNDSFKITGPSGGNGWYVRYYDLNTSAELTSQVTGAGWSSGTLAPGASRGIFVKITPDASVTAGSVNTLLITAASEADDSKIDVVKTVTTFLGTYKTDMLIKAGVESKYTGTGIFNTDGASQTKWLNIYAGQKVAYTFRAQNAGNANDSFRITGTPGGSGWSVKYYDIATNAEVTTQVTGAGWVSGTVAPKGYPGVYANVRPDSTVPLGSTITLIITGISESDNTKTDVVKSVTTCVAAYKPDLLIKNGSDASYIGTDIINADGTDQTKSQSASAGVKVTYSFRVMNSGYLSDSIKITGTAGGAGWSVKYYDLASVDITSQVTGSGWLSGTLLPGTDRGFFVKVSPDTTVTSGSIKTLFITATSVASSTKQDVVKAVTIMQ